MPRTMAFAQSGQTLIVVHSSDPPTDTEWEQWLARMGQHDYRNLLIRSMGGGPTAPQRRKTNAFWRNKTVPRFALVTTSRFVIGIVTAFNWLLNDQLKPFHPKNIKSALDYIEVPPEEREGVLSVLHQLEGELGIKAA